jgi:hypothetical protein
LSYRCAHQGALPLRFIECSIALGIAANAASGNAFNPLSCRYAVSLHAPKSACNSAAISYFYLCFARF